MRHAIALELSGSLAGAPILLGEVPQVDVHCLGNERTGGDGAVAGGKSFVLAMTLMQDNSMDLVHLLYGGQFNILDDGVDKKLEVPNGDATTMEIV